MIASPVGRRLVRAEEIDAALALRREVFVVGQGVSVQIESDGADPQAVHVGVFEGSRLIATGRLLDAGDHARLGRIAVAADRRGTHAGAAVMVALHREALALGLPHCVLHAQGPVVGFYLGLGYECHGEPDMEAGIEHRWMSLSLLPGLRAVRDEDGPGLEDLIGGCWAEHPGVLLDVDAEEPWLRAPASAYSVKPGGQMWVLPGVDGELAACVGMRRVDPDTVELKSLYVRLSARRRGLGAALVALVERHARLADAGAVELWSDSRFADAHRLYARLGYRHEGVTRHLGDISDTTELRFARRLR